MVHTISFLFGIYWNIFAGVSHLLSNGKRYKLQLVVLGLQCLLIYTR